MQSGTTEQRELAALALANAANANVDNCSTIVDVIPQCTHCCKVLGRQKITDGDIDGYLQMAMKVAVQRNYQNH